MHKVKHLVLSGLLVFGVGSSKALAAESGHHKFDINAYYGYAFVSPGDLNTLAKNVGTTPALGSISSSPYFGGSVGYFLGPKIEFEVAYESYDTKTSTNVTSPFSASGAGFEAAQNELWGNLNYYFLEKNKVYGYIGAGVGYPTYSHLTSTLNTVTQYDADKTLGYKGQLGFGVMLGSHFSIYIEGGYMSMVSGNIKTSAGTVLTTASGANAKMDLSGARAQGGIGLFF